LKLDALVAKLNKIEGYRTRFQKAYSSDASPETIARSLASFERTVLSGDAPYDRFKSGDKTALTESAQRGLRVFFNKAHCSACHTGPNFTDGGFHNLGVSILAQDPDLGRFNETKLVGDRGSFKTPTLREIGRTAPYMHDGSLATLEEVVKYYDQGCTPNPQLDEELYALKLSPQEQADLVTFLKEGLSSEHYPNIAPPELPQ
jgi:cytochrome c peroxidase